MINLTVEMMYTHVINLRVVQPRPECNLAQFQYKNVID